MNPFTFHPIYKKRVWGGDSLEKVFNRELPCASAPYGESWELVDRAEDQSVVSSGPFKGLGLHDLWVNHKEQVFGLGMPEVDRFPLLFKILDCQKDLSVQVHPTADVAKELGGEAKTELWYIAAVTAGAKLYVGLKEEITAQDFREAIEEGRVEELVHTIEAEAGDSIQLDSGRLHAIGKGFLIFEIQQNSDTTYRVFDWNRKGLDGKARELHIEEALKCIDFSDVKPKMDNVESNIIVDSEHFQISKHTCEKDEQVIFNNDQFAVLTLVSGVMMNEEKEIFKTGDTVFIPAKSNSLHTLEDAAYLLTIL